MPPIVSSPSPVGHNVKTHASHLHRAFTISPQVKPQQRPRPLPTLAAAADNNNTKQQQQQQQHADTTTITVPSSTNGIINKNNNNKGTKTTATSTPDDGLEQQEISDALKEIIKRRQQRKQSAFSSSTSSVGAPTRPYLTTTTTDKAGLLRGGRAQQQQQQQQQQQLATLSSSPAPLPPAATGALTTKVRFWLQYHAEWGQRLRLVGSSPELGTWALDKGIELAWSEGDNWHCIVDIPAGKVVEYKYVLLDHSGHHAIAWQHGNNSVLALRSADSFVEVFDNWGSTPGAKLVADGAEPVTREKRLLAWATEIEVQMASHKQELRRARMELAAAQEDARIARMETAKVKAQLKESETARVEGVGKLKYAETTNQILQTKMLETTSSFREAMEKAASLLADIDNELEKTNTTNKNPNVGKKEKL